MNDYLLRKIMNLTSSQKTHALLLILLSDGVSKNLNLER